jgi:phosphoribosyl 1,2-cyclic phosphate phosphodiesterase
MRATLTVLGSGTSMGVPTIGCDCAVCHSANPHDRRLRPSIMLQYNGKLVLIDTTPDFREQALREGIKKIDAVLYTHGHADHILGLDDVRPLSFPRVTGGPKIPLYANESTARVLKHVFKYIFDDDYKFGTIAQVELHRLKPDPLNLFDATFLPVPIIHGEAEIYGYRFGSAAYLTDFSTIPENSMEMLQGLDILFLDALRHKPHPTHSTVEHSLSIVQKLNPTRTFFTHISHDLPHAETNRQLPAGVQLAHDGLKLEFEL